MIPEEKQEERIIGFVKELNHQIFEVSVLSYLLFFILDSLFKKIVSNYFSLNLVLIIAIITGIISQLPGMKVEREEASDELKRKDYLFIFLLGSIGCAFIFFKLEAELWIRLAGGVFCGILVILLSIILFNNNSKKQ